jgi:hypothetical protein
MQDPLLGLLPDVGMLEQHRDGVELAGGVGVPIIGANDQAMLTGICENLRQVVVRLTGHIDLKLPEDVVGELPPLGLVAARRLMMDPGHPLRRRFDEPPTQGRE